MPMFLRLSPFSFLLAIATFYLVWFGVVCSAQRAEGDDGRFWAGAAVADLTPKPGVSLDGVISKPGPVRGIHDPLTARAIVMKYQSRRLVLVVNDMCMIDREVLDRAKQAVHAKTGIPVADQLMASTHSHATPRVVGVSRRPADEAYRGFVSQQIVKAIDAAHQNLAPARIACFQFRRPDMVRCRRSLCEVGSVPKNPFGQLGERVQSVSITGGKIIRSAGPVDDEFTALAIQHLDGAPLAILGNFSAHYAGGYATGQVSADYFGEYCKYLASSLGGHQGKLEHPPFVGLMSNGTSGDTGSFSLLSRKFGRWEAMGHFGALLAEATLQGLAKAQFYQPVKLNAVTTELTLRIRRPDESSVQWATQTLRTTRDSHRWAKIYAQETLHLANLPMEERILLQAIRIGDVVIAAAPCEVFAETGLAVKQASPTENTFVMELANGYSGYLPTRQQHEWGGYETWPARSSRLEVGAEEKIRATLIRLCETLR